MREHEYPTAQNKSKANLVETVEQHTSLRKRGREYVGCCPFHDDNNPSFSVSCEKQLFHCFGCGVGGDIIRFVELIQGITFKEAIQHLGVENHQRRPHPHRQKAKEVAAWADEMSGRLADHLHQISRAIRMCEIATRLGIDVAEYRAELDREWAILADLADDISDPETVMGIYAERADVESFVGGLSS